MKDLEIIKQALDVAVQKGVYTLSDVSTILGSLESLTEKVSQLKNDTK